jgi:hypothetical protein
MSGSTQAAPGRHYNDHRPHQGLRQQPPNPPPPPRLRDLDASVERHRSSVASSTSTRSLDPTGAGRVRWTMRWKPVLNAFAITFGDRWPAAETY